MENGRMNIESMESTLDAHKKRCCDDVVRQQREYFNKGFLFKQGLDATYGMIFILNNCQQIIFANKALLTMVGMENISQVLGKKFCEIINCIYANSGSKEGGTDEACKYCNGINTVLKAMELNEGHSGEFSSVNRLNGCESNFNAFIHVAPLEVHGEIFYVVSFTNNSELIGKRMLEKTFFHDIINTAGALKGIIGLLKSDVPDLIKSEVEFVEKTFSYLIEEIQMQKNIMEAENNELVLELTAVDSFEILSSASKLYDGYAAAESKTIKVSAQSEQIIFSIDYKLLRRILGNMIKNALEATAENGIVTIGCSRDEEEEGFLKFWVHNDKYMDERTQKFVFQRPFSTKGEGRGLGTYSMNLIVRKYLHGKVDFFTEKQAGTTFYIKLPLESKAKT